METRYPRGGRARRPAEAPPPGTPIVVGQDGPHARRPGEVRRGSRGRRPTDRRRLPTFTPTCATTAIDECTPTLPRPGTACRARPVSRSIVAPTTHYHTMRPVIRPSFLILPLVALATAACGSSLRVPEPHAPGQVAALPPSEPAVIALPVTISLDVVRDRLDAAFPITDSLDRARCTALGGAVCHQYVYRREPLRLQMVDDRFSLAAPLRYRGRMALPRLGGVGSCGYAPESMRRAELRFATSLYWRSDWRLGSRSTALAADLQDRCEVTLLGVDATPLMRRMADAQLRDMRHDLDSIIPALVDLGPAADSLWRLLQQPMALDSAGGAWLTMGPDAVGLAPVSGAAGAIRTAVVMTARPRVVLGARPADGARPLPPLTVAPPASGLRVPVDVRLPFDELGRRATTLLAAESAGSGVRVREVRVWGAGDTAVVRLELDGRVDGTLYLVGRLGYDADARVLRLDDLRYTVESASAMTRLKVTLGAPLVRRALDQATAHGRLHVGAQLDSLRGQLTARLNRRLGPGVAVGGGVQDVRVVGLYVTSDAFVVRVVLTGTAQLFVQ